MSTEYDMYVYFDKNGEIKSVSPVPIVEFTGIYSVHILPLGSVHPFLVGEQNIDDYHVKESIQFANSVFTIVKKEPIKIDRLRYINNSFVKITEYTQPDYTTILVENCVIDKIIRVTLHPDIILAKSDSDNVLYADACTVLSVKRSELYFTKKCDPHFLLHTVSFSPAELFLNTDIYFPYDCELKNTSLFTKPLIDGYRYLNK